MELKRGEKVLFWVHGQGFTTIEVMEERTSDEMKQVIKEDLRKSSRILGVIDEIPSYAWLITSGNRAYIYSGIPEGAKIAKGIIANFSQNRGNTTRMEQLVG